MSHVLATYQHERYHEVKIASPVMSIFRAIDLVLFLTHSLKVLQSRATGGC